MTWRLLLTLASVLSLMAIELTADVSVVMDNGDVLSGEIVGETETDVTLEVDYLGRVTLPKARVANLADLDPALAALHPAAPVIGTEESLESGIAMSVPQPIWEVYDERIAAIFPFRSWQKRIQLGMTVQSGRFDRSDIYYRYDMQRSREKSDYRFNAEYTYGKSQEKVTDNKLATGFRWRRDIGPGVFYQSTTNYGSDAIKLIDTNVEQKLGLGTRFLERENVSLSSGLGASGRWRTFDSEQPDEVVYLLDLFQDWDYRINERLRLRQDLRFAMPVEENDMYEYNFTAALVSELTESLNLSLRYELGYDNSLAPELKSDRRFISTIGYTF